MLKQKKFILWKQNPIWGYIITTCLFLFIFFLFLFGLSKISDIASKDSASTLKQGITRATVRCYAIEGRYPPSISYLEDNYGIHIDKERFSVFYSGFASNIMPEITVIEK